LEKIGDTGRRFSATYPAAPSLAKPAFGLDAGFSP
jgi:hypothetical protein